jgi:hypothetical protein
LKPKPPRGPNWRHDRRKALSQIRAAVHADHELHPRIAEIVLRLKDQRLEHRHRIERWAATFGPIAIAETLDQPAPEILEIHRRIEHLERVAVRAQPLQMFRQSKQ